MAQEMRELYPKRALFELTPPLNDRDKFQELPEMEFQALLPEFQKKSISIREHVLSNTMPI